MNTDDDALQELVDSCHGRLVGLLRLRGCSVEDADDLAQDALLRLVQHWSASAPVGNWWAWLVTVAINLQVSQWRRAANFARRKHLLRGDHEHHDPNTLEALDLLQGLAERQRTAVILRHYAGLSVRETAEAAEWSMLVPSDEWEIESVSTRVVGQSTERRSEYWAATPEEGPWGPVVTGRFLPGPETRDLVDGDKDYRETETWIGQVDHLLPTLTATENVELALQFQGTRRDRAPVPPRR